MDRQPFNPNLMRGAGHEPAASPPNPPSAKASPALSASITVSQLTALIKVALQRSLPPTVHVIGQISNCKRHTSGHLYLTLKDGGSEISCVMWRSDAVRLKFNVSDGLEVVATGMVEVFDRAGRYQLYIRQLEPRGVGALELAYRQLCEKLRGEGLFDPARKKPLPRFPQRIALITSPTGAAIRDVLHTLHRRYPCLHVLVFPVRVQGPGAAGEIAAAVRAINAHHQRLGGVDLMIVGRGGGSLEDLWAFNEEVVSRAIFASRIPIISGVGHETDVTISDLVADLRAPTPTAAAELAVPELADVLAGVNAFRERLLRGANARLQLCHARLQAATHRRTFSDPLIVVRRREQVLDVLHNAMHRNLVQRLHGIRVRLDKCEPWVRRIAPHDHLRRTSEALSRAEQKLALALNRRLSRADRSVGDISGRLARLPLLSRLMRAQQRTEHLSCTIPIALRHRMDLGLAAVNGLEKLLQAVSHKSVLARGFSITRLKKGRLIVRSIRDVSDGDRLTTQVADGEFESRAVNVKQMELFEE